MRKNSVSELQFCSYESSKWKAHPKTEIHFLKFYRGFLSLYQKTYEESIMIFA